jgi:hypothetical protein
MLHFCLLDPASSTPRPFLHRMCAAASFTSPFSEAVHIEIEIEWVRNRYGKKRICETYEKAQKITGSFYWR